MQVISTETERPECISIMGKYTVEDCPGCPLPLWRIALFMPGQLGVAWWCRSFRRVWSFLLQYECVAKQGWIIIMATWQDLFSILTSYETLKTFKGLWRQCWRYLGFSEFLITWHFCMTNWDHWLSKHGCSRHQKYKFEVSNKWIIAI